MQNNKHNHATLSQLRDQELLTLLYRLVPELERRQTVAPDVELRELGIDSLALIRLIVELDVRFALPPQKLISLTRKCTLGDICQLVSASC